LWFWLKRIDELESQVSQAKDKDFGFVEKGLLDLDHRLSKLKTKILVLVK
jgi:hypothetical protein